jgi:aminopeptidase
MSAESPSLESTAALARALLTKNLRVKAGERVTVEAWTHTVPWAAALAREARRLKALPLILYEDEAAYWDAVEHGAAKTVGTPAQHEWAALGKTDVYIHMWGPGDRVRLNALPPAQQGAVSGFNDAWYATARKAGLRGLRWEVGRPYPTLAKAYGVDQETWSGQIVAASGIDPQLLARRASPLARALRTGRSLTITHPNGTDLTLGLAKREPTVHVGIPHPGDRRRPFDLLANVPSGAVRVALDETVAEGTFVGNRTCYYDDGVAKEPRFEFSGGRLRERSFASGQERFDAPYAKAGKGKDQPGFLSIGLNPELHDTPQVEDIEDGAVLVSVGGNRNLGGKNAASFFGWAVLAGASVEVDGRPLPVGGPSAGSG